MEPSPPAEENVPQNGAPGMSEDEIALYDRQIRLWGMRAQEKIRGASILLITMKALANEIAKNLVLAGVGTLTLLDGDAVAPADLGAQFLLSEIGSDDARVVGRNRAEAASHHLQKLNPRVRVVVDTEGVKPKHPAYFGNFDIIIATDLDPTTLNIINTATRLHNKAFYAAGSHGIYGYIFCDLIEHDYVIQRDIPNIATQTGPTSRTCSVVQVATVNEGDKRQEVVTKRELYSTWFLASDAAGLPEEYRGNRRKLRNVTPVLSCMRAVWEFEQLTGRHPRGSPTVADDLDKFIVLATTKHKALHLPAETLTSAVLRRFLQNIGCEIAPVVAILGGQLAQDVINLLGQNQPPLQNMLVFDGDAMEATVFALHPEGALGRALLSNVNFDTALLVPNGATPASLE